MSFFVVVGTIVIFAAAFVGGWLLSSAIDNRVGTSPDPKVYLYAFLKMALASAGFWLGMLGLAYVLATGLQRSFLAFRVINFG